jgi:hypothetical protein
LAHPHLLPDCPAASRGVCRLRWAHASRPPWTAGGPRRDRPADRRSSGARGRLRLPCLSLQPGDPRATPAGVGVQAIRLRGGARARRLPRDSRPWRCVTRVRGRAPGAGRACRPGRAGGSVELARGALSFEQRGGRRGASERRLTGRARSGAPGRTSGAAGCAVTRARHRAGDAAGAHRRLRAVRERRVGSRHPGHPGDRGPARRNRL